MKYLILLIFTFSLSPTLSGQHNIKMLNARDIDTERYKDFKGSAYLWKENKEVIIYDKNARDYESVMANYNIAENEFEIYQNNKFIELPHNTYIKVEVINDEEYPYSFYSNVHPKLKNKYCILHKKAANYSVFESPTAKKSMVKLETPGKATEINKIIKKTEYYLVYGSDLIPFKISKKKLIKQFGHKKEIKSFLKSSNNKIKKIEDVILLFNFLESKGWLATPN